jgi:predicted metal-dependent enzyme (double-stranded beta helix superfamily)
MSPPIATPSARLPGLVAGCAGADGLTTGPGEIAVGARAELTADLAAAWVSAPARWRRLVHHVPGDRWYLPLFQRPGVSVWLITWAPGTGLDLHDHGGSSGTVAVVGGELTERHSTTGEILGAYPAGRGGPADARAVLRRRRLGRGTLTTFAADHVHEVRNDSRAPAVSIHVYAPGLEEMAFYGAPAADRPGVRTRTEVVDPRPLPSAPPGPGPLVSVAAGRPSTDRTRTPA